jgi:hypothetical protein|uniref:Uncharacterized protein n=1 Tax=Sipha flava TaxID=143950 RepID=A0A2S2QMR5_9HEMI
MSERDVILLRVFDERVVIVASSYVFTNRTLFERRRIGDPSNRTTNENGPVNSTANHYGYQGGTPEPRLPSAITATDFVFDRRALLSTSETSNRIVRVHPLVIVRGTCRRA